MKQEIGLALIAMGFLILLAGMAQDFGQGRASYGGVTLVGSIPIVVGSSPQMAVIAMLMAMVLMILTFVLF